MINGKSNFLMLLWVLIILILINALVVMYMNSAYPTKGMRNWLIQIIYQQKIINEN